MILVGLFIAENERRYWGYGFAAVAFFIAVAIFYQTSTRLGWYWGGYGSDAIGFILLAILIAGVIIAVGASGGGRTSEERKRAKAGKDIAKYLGWQS